jgi:hypothetical protein
MTSTIKVNKIEKVDGSTIELGGPGTAVNLACGATQSGFGRTGTVDWCTTAKTTPFTAVSGDGFFVNTTSGGITVTLPSSPSAGDIVAFKDYANTWDCNAVTVCRNGSKINGICANSTLNTQSQSVTLIYVDGTKGWQDIHDSTSNVTGRTFISASGGTETTSGNFKIHTFTSSGTFTVSSASNQAPFNDVSYMVVAGGGGSGGGGGGAGGFRENKGSEDSYTASPLEGSSNITVTAQAYPITVGAGGAAKAGSPYPSPGNDGTNSVFSTITSAGGGGSGGYETPGNNGGSGAGGSSGGTQTGGNGNTPPVSPPQGNNGGSTSGSGGADAGGGGASAVGGNMSSPPYQAGAGGAGVTTEITASPVAYSGGGGGASDQPGLAGAGGTGGGGTGKSPNQPGEDGTANTGGGAGGATRASGSGKTGGSGIVVIRYKFQ